MRKKRVQKGISLLLAMLMFVSMIAVQPSALAAGGDSASAEYELYPIPQSIAYEDSVIKLPSAMNVFYGSSIDEYTKNRAVEAFKEVGITLTETGADQAAVLVGVASDNDAALAGIGVSASDEVFTKIDGYRMKTVGDKIYIVGRHTDAAFYGLTTLLQMLQQVDDSTRKLRRFDPFSLGDQPTGLLHHDAAVQRVRQHQEVPVVRYREHHHGRCAVPAVRLPLPPGRVGFGRRAHCRFGILRNLLHHPVRSSEEAGRLTPSWKDHLKLHSRARRYRHRLRCGLRPLPNHPRRREHPIRSRRPCRMRTGWLNGDLRPVRDLPRARDGCREIACKPFYGQIASLTIKPQQQSAIGPSCANRKALIMF